MEVDVKPNEDENTDLKKQRNKNFLIVIAVILFTAGGTSIVLALLIQEGGEETSNMKALIEAACETEKPTIVDINTCSQADCTFDTSICEIPCPFDYSTDESECPISCECADHGLYQGDVAFVEEEVMDLAERYGYVDNENDFALFYGTLKTNVRLWTDSPVNGRYQVPYELDSTATQYVKLINSLKKLTKLLSERTCIDLVKRTNEKHYLLLWDDGRSCSSFKGSIVDYQSPQKVSLTRGCHHFSTVQHEIMHALGFAHKHVRPDRDAYIEIFWDNINKKRVNNFARIAKDKVIKSNVLYEIKSVMHYSSSYFTIVPGQPSMLERGTGANIPQKDFEQEYTDGDIQVLNSAYECLKTSYTARYANWGPWSPCDETCGSGEKHRYRKCQDSQGQYAKGCHGDAHETQKCEGPACTSSEQWLSWGPWEDCKGSCGFGYRIKYSDFFDLPRDMGILSRKLL